MALSQRLTHWWGEPHRFGSSKPQFQLLSFCPIFDWLPKYDWRKKLSFDIIAGIDVLHHVNIANFALGRNSRGAVGVVNVDEEVDSPAVLDNAVAELRRVSAIREAWVVRLP